MGALSRTFDCAGESFPLASEWSVLVVIALLLICPKVQCVFDGTCTYIARCIDAQNRSTCAALISSEGILLSRVATPSLKRERVWSAYYQTLVPFYQNQVNPIRLQESQL